MTISSSLNASVAGLQANATRLATISDNIANSSTYGYKRAVAEFESHVISSKGSTYSAGGVRTTTQRLVDERGSLIASANSTDIAVRGRGMLPVANATDIDAPSSDRQMYLTSTGSFRADSKGYLTSESGLVLMGWPARPDGTIPVVPRDTSQGLEPVQIDINQYSGEPTTTVTLGVNLPATATEASSDGTVQNVSVEYFDNLGTSQSIIVSFTPTVPDTGASHEWTMMVEDSATPDTTIGEFRLTFNDSRGTGGTLASIDDLSSGTPVSATSPLVVNVAGGPIEIDIGDIGDSNGITQLSDTFAPVSIRKDGYPVAIGNMTGVEIDANGFIVAHFNNGITRTVYQIPLVDLPNPNGMVALNHQIYLPSPDSGSYFLWNAGDGPTGDLVSFAREESSVDVAKELTTMIQTQRAYSSNAKVIQVVDEMLQEATNIKR